MNKKTKSNPKGAGRNKKLEGEKLIQKGITLSKDQWRTLDDIASLTKKENKKKKSPSAIIRGLIDDADFHYWRPEFIA